MLSPDTFAALTMEDTLSASEGKSAYLRGEVADTPLPKPETEENDDPACAICLNHIPAVEIAQPVGCEHIYCTCCLLHWSIYKEKPWCPQCKVPFSSLLTFRALDGQLHDYPTQESLCFMKRARWFQEHVKRQEQLTAEATAPRPSSAGLGYLDGSVIDDTDYVDYARYYEEYDDDEEVENYYFSAAAGRARVVIGNRRHGPNGYISSGRIQAQPAAPPIQSKARKGKAAKGVASGSSLDDSKGLNTPDKRCGAAGSEVASSSRGFVSGGSCDSKGAGRRARRNQRRAAADARAGL